jgi:hypothetical protein
MNLMGFGLGSEPLSRQEQEVGGPGLCCSPLCIASSSCTKTCLTVENSGSSCGADGVCNHWCCVRTRHDSLPVAYRQFPYPIRFSM